VSKKDLIKDKYKEDIERIQNQGKRKIRAK